MSVDDPVGLLLPAVDEEPAWALGNVAADEQDPEAEGRAHREGDPPADVGGEDRLVEEDQRQDAAPGRAEPETSR